MMRGYKEKQIKEGYKIAKQGGVGRTKKGFMGIKEKMELLFSQCS